MANSKAKSTSVKKSIKSNKNKKFSFKNLDFKKNWKKLSYLGLASFLALSSIGYGGWKFYEQNSASASGWVTFYRSYPGGTSTPSSWWSSSSFTHTGGSLRACVVVRARSQTATVRVEVSSPSRYTTLLSSYTTVGTSPKTVCSAGAPRPYDSFRVTLYTSGQNVFVDQILAQRNTLNAY